MVGVVQKLNGTEQYIWYYAGSLQICAATQDVMRLMAVRSFCSRCFANHQASVRVTGTVGSGACEHDTKAQVLYLQVDGDMLAEGIVNMKDFFTEDDVRSWTAAARGLLEGTARHDPTDVSATNGFQLHSVAADSIIPLFRCPGHNDGEIIGRHRFC